MLGITSAPLGAKAELSTGQECVTPCLVKVARKSDVQVNISLEGYEGQTATVYSSFDSVGLAAQAGNTLGGLWIWGVAGSYVFVETLIGGGAGVGPWILGAGGIAYIVVASERDRREGKLRSLQPNPLHVELQPSASISEGPD